MPCPYDWHCLVGWLLTAWPLPLCMQSKSAFAAMQRLLQAPTRLAFQTACISVSVYTMHSPCMHAPFPFDIAISWLFCWFLSWTSGSLCWKV